MSLVSSQHLEDSNDCSAKPRRVVGNEREGAAQLRPIPLPRQRRLGAGFSSHYKWAVRVKR